MRYLAFAILLFITFSTQAQMKPVEELINNTDPGWPLVQDWINHASNKVEVLPADSARAREALYHTQITTRSPMGAIIYATGGILVDSGWIRILGSGSNRLNRSLPDWNKGKTLKEFGSSPGFLLVADDVVGGFFAINGGDLGTDAGKVYYLAPNTLEWEPLNLSYSAFLDFCFTGDLKLFYADMQWLRSHKDAMQLNGNQVFSFYPAPWTKEGEDPAKSSRTGVPVEEFYRFVLSTQQQLGLPVHGI